MIWRDIVDPVYATGYQREMLNAGSNIMKEMNSLVIVRLLLTGPCLHNFPFETFIDRNEI